MSNFVASAYKSLETMLRSEQPLQQAPAAAATPPKPSSPRSASAAPVDPFVRTEPEKYGGAIYVEEIVPERTPRPAEKAKFPPVTLDDLVREWRLDQTRATHRALRLGDLAQRWILKQPERPASEQLDRASALKMIRRALLAAGIDRRSCRVDRYVRCWHVARLLGGEPDSLSISAIRELQPLIERDAATEQWHLVPAHADKARGLWARMHGEHLSAEVVREAVERIRHPDPLPIETQRRRSRLPRLLRELSSFSIADLRQIRKAVNAQIAASQPGRTPAAA